MNAAKKRLFVRQKHKKHIRKKISGTNDRPRVTVFRTSNHIYGQVIDDVNQATVCSVSSLEKEIKDKIEGSTGNVKAAKVVGKILGERLLAKGHQAVIFDRNGFLYHGRVKSFADGIREAGIKF